MWGIVEVVRGMSNHHASEGEWEGVLSILVGQEGMPLREGSEWSEQVNDTWVSGWAGKGS
jgi:hypothetical protein